MNDGVHGEGHAVRLHPGRDENLLRVRARARDLVGAGLYGILHAELQVIESRFDERGQPLLRQAEAGGDEAGVEIGAARRRHELDDVGARQRLAAGEVHLQRAERAGLTEDVGPDFGRQLLRARRHLERVRAVDAVERAAVRDLGDEGQGAGRDRHSRSRARFAHSRSTNTSTSCSMRAGGASG